MRSFVFFKDNILFSPKKIWRIEHIISKFKKTKVDLFQFGTVKVMTNTDKQIQEGIIITAKDEVDAVDIYENIKKVLNG